MTTTTNWTEADADEARREGWDIFECFGSDNGDWQLQRLDSPEDWAEIIGAVPPTFDTDEDAWHHVVARAFDCSGLHRKALGFIAENNPQELLAIQKAVMPGRHGDMSSDTVGDMTNTADSPADWYVYEEGGRYFVVDTLAGDPVRKGPATARDIAQATLRGKMRS